MIRSYVTSLAALAALSCPALVGAMEPTPDQPTKPTLAINLTSGIDNLHAVVMALHFAEHGLADGREVVVFFNVKAPPLARDTLDDSIQFKDLPPVRSMLANLIKQGATMVVCPMGANVMGVKEAELARGIAMIKDRKQIFDHLHHNSVAFTY